MTAPFDPAAWLERAELCGYRLWVTNQPDGTTGVYTANPDRRQRKWPYDDRLWHDLRGDPATADSNEEALYQHLVKTGRVRQ